MNRYKTTAARRSKTCRYEAAATRRIRIQGVLFAGMAAVVVASLSFAADPGDDGTDSQTLQLVEKAAAIRKARYRARGKDEGIEKLTDDEIARIAEYYRKKFPFTSLRARLEYEAKLDPNRPAPKLSKEAAERIAALRDSHGEISGGLYFKSNLRLRSLQTLHSEHVRRFITQEGFGIARIAPPSPEYLDLAAEDAIPFPTVPILSTEHLESEKIELLDDEPDFNEFGAERSAISKYNEWLSDARKKYRAWSDKQNPLAVPSRPRLLDLHQESREGFASRYNNGYVKDVDHVSGFTSHFLSAMPEFNLHLARSDYHSHIADEAPPVPNAPDEPATNQPGAAASKPAPPKPLWQIRRMHLVSLLKHDAPRVYLSDRPPNMEALSSEKTRDLDPFETPALARLREGEDIVVDSHVNRIAMLGSLRASKACIECHSVAEGELLGAFSYELIRVKPIAGKRLRGETN